MRKSCHSHTLLCSFETLQQTERKYNIRYMKYDNKKKCAYTLHEHAADASHQWWAESLRMEDKIINRYVIESTGILIFTSNLSSWFNISVSIHSRVSQRLLECQNVYLLQSTVTLERLGFSQWFNNQTWSAGADIIEYAIQQNWSLNERMLLGSFWNQKNQL